MTPLLQHCQQIAIEVIGDLATEPADREIHFGIAPAIAGVLLLGEVCIEQTPGTIIAIIIFSLQIFIKYP
jgi:hypothetical protein